MKKNISDQIRTCQKLVKNVIDVDQATLDLLILPIICGGHALVHGMIGTGKSVAVLALAGTLNLKGGMYQCHPETMPADLIGFEKFNQAKKTFEVKLGPVSIYQILLIDEINRMSPRSQAALLGPMGQGFVTIGDEELRPIEQPFVVYATQNPIESQGVYPLSEAAVDRFMIQIPWPYHSFDAVKTIMGYHNAADTQKRVDALEPFLSERDILQARQEVDKMPLGKASQWITALYLACCPSNSLDGRAPRGWNSPEETDECVLYGPSPRGLRDLAQAARGLAFLRGGGERPIQEEDIRDLAIPVLRHRIILKRMLPSEYRGCLQIDQVDMFIERAFEEARSRWNFLPEFREVAP